MKLGVTGATGKLGQLAVEYLKSKTAKENIIALVRDPQKASKLGVEARVFDYAKPETLAEALNGIDKILLISSNEIGQRAIQHKNVIKAAKVAGIKEIVYTSLLHADTSSLSLAGEHLETEQALKESGIDYVILRNGWYTENYSGSIGSALAGGAFIGSAVDGKISSASRADFAEAAANVLAGNRQTNKTYELAGDSAYTLTELAKEISKQSGKDIPYKDLPENEYASILKNFGLPDTFAGAIASWDVSASKGDLFDDKKQLSVLIGRETTSFKEVVKNELAALK